MKRHLRQTISDLRYATRDKRRALRALPLALCALLLSACAPGQPSIQQQAAEFVTRHTICDPTHYNAPRWSADGTRVIYGISQGSKNSIRWVDASGGDNRLLATDAYVPLPSPDGRWLLYMTTDPQTGMGPYSTLLDLTTRETRPIIYVGGSASWSPDGKWIAFNHPGGPLIKVEAETGEWVTLVDDITEDVTDVAPEWSPDGEHLLFMAGRSPETQALYVAEADGSGAARLTSLHDTSCNPSNVVPNEIGAWNPDSSTVVIPTVCGSTIGLSTLSLGGEVRSAPREIPAALAVVHWSPAATPEGERKQYLMIDYTNHPPTLFATGVDGLAPLSLWPNAWDADWSPTGDRIAFTGDDAAGLVQVWVINADGTGLTQLTSNPGTGGICLH